nr:globin [Curtobacterium sp. 9128]
MSDTPEPGTPMTGIPLGGPPVAGPGGAPAGVPGQPITLRVGRDGGSASGSLFDRIGGAPTFDRLVRRFYEGVQQDDVIWPMYPQDDLEGAIWRLSQFLQQYWGGPTTYSEERGHPRLRMRHMPFRITSEARERWLHHMRDAVESLQLAPLDEAELWAYLDRAAHAMTNSFD